MASGAWAVEELTEGLDELRAAEELAEELDELQAPDGLAEELDELRAVEEPAEELDGLRAVEEPFLCLSLPLLETRSQSELHWSGFEREVCVKPRQRWGIAEPSHRDQTGAASRV
jgi:hypothetical protein